MNEQEYIYIFPSFTFINANHGLETGTPVGVYPGEDLSVVV